MKIVFMKFLLKVYTISLDMIQTLVIAGAIFVVIYAFLFRPFQVNGESMFPNYENGEYILTSLISLRFSDPQRGDVIVFEAPIDEEKDFIKRVIGTPGDTVSIKEGHYYVNGKKLDESEYLASDVITSGGAFLNNKAVTVPQDQYFVSGDNRPFSSDSRQWGFVPKDKVIGKSMIVYWPPQRFRLVKHAKLGD